MSRGCQNHPKSILVPAPPKKTHGPCSLLRVRSLLRCRAVEQRNRICQLCERLASRVPHSLLGFCWTVQRLGPLCSSTPSQRQSEHENREPREVKRQRVRWSSQKLELVLCSTKFKLNNAPFADVSFTQRTRVIHCFGLQSSGLEAERAKNTAQGECSKQY